MSGSGLPKARWCCWFMKSSVKWCGCCAKLAPLLFSTFVRSIAWGSTDSITEPGPYTVGVVVRGPGELREGYEEGLFRPRVPGRAWTFSRAVGSKVMSSTEGTGGRADGTVEERGRERQSGARVEATVQRRCRSAEAQKRRGQIDRGVGARWQV